MSTSTLLVLERWIWIGRREIVEGDALPARANRLHDERYGSGLVAKPFKNPWSGKSNLIEAISTATKKLVMLTRPFEYGKPLHVH
jgi:hypothetical protein